MGSSTAARAAQLLARIWVVAAVASLALPSLTRLGWWLPLHLALAGGASTAVAGAAPDFAAAISAGRTPRWVGLPIPLVSLGAAAIAVGVPSGTHPLVATGGALFAAGAIAIAAAVRSSWRSGLNRRHRAIAHLYVFAALCPAFGAPLGAVLGAGVVGGDAFLQLRRAHVELNLLGFLGLTVVATSVLLVPTVLRVRSPAWRPAGPFLALAFGVVVTASGAAAGARTIAALGATVYAVGALEVVAMAVLALGAIGWTAALAVGTSDRFLLALVAAVAVGTVVQGLLGAWSHLVPMSAPGGPELHRRRLERADRFAPAQVAGFNLGVVLVVEGAGGLLPSAWATVGAALVSTAVLGVVVKVSAPLARRP